MKMVGWKKEDEDECQVLPQLFIPNRLLKDVQNVEIAQRKSSVKKNGSPSSAHLSGNKSIDKLKSGKNRVEDGPWQTTERVDAVK